MHRLHFRNHFGSSCFGVFVVIVSSAGRFLPSTLCHGLERVCCLRHCVTGIRFRNKNMSAHCVNCIRQWPQRNPGCPLCRVCPFCLPLWLNAGWRCHQCSNTRRVTSAHFGCTLLEHVPFATLVQIATFCGLDDTWGRLHWINRIFRTVMTQRNRLYAIQNFPSLVDDERIWGRPTTFWPYPEWMSWEIRILVYMENPRVANPATWMEWERYWARSLDDVLHLLNAFEPTGGLYTRLVINLEQWQWTYQFDWERVDHL